MLGKCYVFRIETVMYWKESCMKSSNPLVYVTLFTFYLSCKLIHKFWILFFSLLKEPFVNTKSRIMINLSNIHTNIM